jgi:hypothetical protein
VNGNSLDGEDVMFLLNYLQAHSMYVDSTNTNSIVRVLGQCIRITNGEYSNLTSRLHFPPSVPTFTSHFHFPPSLPTSSLPTYTSHLLFPHSLPAFTSHLHFPLQFPSSILTSFLTFPSHFHFRYSRMFITLRQNLLAHFIQSR